MENRIERIKEKAIQELEKKIDFWEELRNSGQLFRPMFHQANPIYEAIGNGIKRILLAGATSSGKTLPISLMISHINKKRSKKSKGLWIAPDQTIRTALIRDVNRYVADFDLPPLEIASITDEKSMLEKADILYMNYYKLGYTSLDNNRFISQIKKLAPSIDIIVLDECQNLKNPSADRTKNFEQFINLTLDKYFILASASPCHNRLKDLGSIFHILDPANYPLREYDYNSNPRAIVDFMARGKWFTFTRDDLKAIYPGLPRVPKEENGLIRELNVNIPDEYAKKYFEIWADRDIPSGRKLMTLRKISLDGLLAADDKDSWFRDLVKDTKNRGYQIGIFSYLRDGIVDQLVRKSEEIFGKGKVGYVDGTVRSFEKRVEIANRFSQGDLSLNVYTTKTMGEGIPSLAYEMPILGMFFEPAFNQGDFDQPIGRFYRIGQTGEVEILTILSQNKLLEELQEGVKLKMINEGIKIRGGWTPGTVHQDINNLRKAKVKTYEKLITGQKNSLSSMEEQIMNASINPFASKLDDYTIGCLTSLIQVEKEENRRLKVLSALNKLHGIGKEELKLAIEGKGAHAGYYKEIKDNLHLIHSARQTALLISEAVTEIEKKSGRLECIADFGCGPEANVARALNRPIINLDASREMLAKTEKICKEYNLECKYIHSFMQTTPFKDYSLNAIIASNSLNFNRNKKDDREIENIIAESNRILKPEGYFIITFPNGRSVSEKDFNNLTILIEDYGLKPLVSDVFKGINEKGKTVFKGSYLLIAKKIEEKNEYSNFKYDLFLPREYVLSGGEKFTKLTGELYNLFRQRKDEYQVKDKSPSLIYVTEKGQNLKELLK